MKIIFTSPGRRVELIEIFRKVFPNAELYGADYDQTSPANYILDKVFKLPYNIDDIYVKKVLKICRDKKIGLLIPLIDPELFFLAKYREEFFKIGTFIMISNPKVLNICLDKWKTYQFLKKHKFSLPNTCLGSSFRRNNFKNAILFKPRKGSASKDIYICKNLGNIGIFEDLLNNSYIIQEWIEGHEVTVDVFASEDGQCIEAVQRRRLKIRGGEVERGVTQKDPYIFKMVKDIVKNLKPLGVINIQFIHDLKNNKKYVMEINPRFGGGYPLAHATGANFPLLLSKLANRKSLVPVVGSYKDHYYMLRYDRAIYTDRLVNLW